MPDRIHNKMRGIMAESLELTLHPSKDVRAFAESVYDFLSFDIEIDDVRAIEKALDIMGELIQYHQHYCEVEMNEEKVIREKAILAIRKVSEHFR